MHKYCLGSLLAIGIQFLCVFSFHDDDCILYVSGPHLLSFH